MAIYLGEQKINAVMQPFARGVKTVQIGAVSAIRFSLISGKLKVGWTDPDDIYYDEQLVSQWKKTRLVMNSYPVGTEITNDSYPASPDDYDALILETDEKNKFKYSLYECPFTFADDKIYCFRFFTCNTFDGWSVDEKFKGSCIFRSGSETWESLMYKLEHFPEMYSEDPSQSVLPQPGGEVDLNYILNDQSKFTRDAFLSSINSLSSVVTPFVILDYNATVPQYVKYVKENQDGSKTYKWVSSLDDSADVIQVKDIQGRIMQQKALTGDMLFRPIVGGCRVYDKVYDPLDLSPSYIDTNEVVLCSSYDLNSFEYLGNISALSINKYKAPMKILIGDDEYTFVGYTMTIQSKSALYSNGNTIIFDIDEYQFASPFNFFDGKKQFFYVNEGIYTEIDTAPIIGQNISTFKVNGTQVDVWSREEDNGQMTLETMRYSFWKHYRKVTLGDIDAGCVVRGFKSSNLYFQYKANEKVAYNSAIYNVVKDVPTSYTTAPDKDIGEQYYKKVGEYGAADIIATYNWQPGNVRAVNQYVVYNDQVWKVIKATTTAQTGTPDTLPEYYQSADIGVKDEDWFIDGEKIPCGEFMKIVEINDSNRYTYGNNLYSESNMRQWLNAAAGRDDNWFVAKNRFDRRPAKSTNMYATSCFPLKLAKNDDFFEHVIPAANITRISDVQYQYMSSPYTTKYAGGVRETVVNDRFFLLSYCEVGFGQYDAMNTFRNIFFDNTSRQRYNMGSNGVISTTSTAYWWLRYPYTGYSNVEYYVHTSGGSSSYYTANHSYGCVPACILG